MKIVKDNSQKIYCEPDIKITCKKCESELEYNKSDLTHTFWRVEGWTNSSIKYKGFICPCCGYEMGIETLIGS